MSNIWICGMIYDCHAVAAIQLPKKKKLFFVTFIVITTVSQVLLLNINSPHTIKADQSSDSGHS